MSLYRQGDFIDLCRGPHVASTGQIKAFKLLSTSGAYWRGDEHNPMLWRIYGTAWLSQEDLDRYLWRLEEAKKRDHRKLGRELDLFEFHDVSPGAAFWLPNGMILVRELERFAREELDACGYQEISTPLLVNKRLWEQSGHWELYSDNMFKVEVEEEIFSLKPMNCPESTYVYRRTLRSYRDLPLRLSEMGRCHRNERSGTLTGLVRVRQFTQDDAHIYCRPDQLQDEITALLGLVRELVRDVRSQAELQALHAPGEVARHAGAVGPGGGRPLPGLGRQRPRLQAESRGRRLLRTEDRHRRRGRAGPSVADRHDPGGPDHVARALPARVHRRRRAAQAPGGHPPRRSSAPTSASSAFSPSTSRAPFPPWLAPVQARVIPISEKHSAYARTVHERLRAARLRAELDDRNEKLGYRIRDAQLRKVPYMLVVGEREAQNGTVSLRHRGGEDLGAAAPRTGGGRPRARDRRALPHAHRGPLVSPRPPRRAGRPRGRLPRTLSRAQCPRGA